MNNQSSSKQSQSKNPSKLQAIVTLVQGVLNYSKKKQSSQSHLFQQAQTPVQRTGTNLVTSRTAQQQRSQNSECLSQIKNGGSQNDFKNQGLDSKKLQQVEQHVSKSHMGSQQIVQQDKRDQLVTSSISRMNPQTDQSKQKSSPFAQQDLQQQTGKSKPKRWEVIEEVVGSQGNHGSKRLLELSQYVQEYFDKYEDQFSRTRTIVQSKKATQDSVQQSSKKSQFSSKGHIGKRE